MDDDLSHVMGQQEPWAVALHVGVKPFEGRNRQLKINRKIPEGKIWVLFHKSLAKAKKAAKVVRDQEFESPWLYALPGHIWGVGQMSLEKCEAENVKELGDGTWFGIPETYSHYYIVHNFYVFEKPILTKGEQGGWWKLDDNLAQASLVIRGKSEIYLEIG